MAKSNGINEGDMPETQGSNGLTARLTARDGGALRGRSQGADSMSDAEFWREECRKRAELLAGIEWAGADGYGDIVCPDCGWEKPSDPDRVIEAGYRTHDPSCDLTKLMTMPKRSRQHERRATRSA